MKVYCENCKYLRDNVSRYSYRPIQYFCFSPMNMTTSEDPIYQGKKLIFDPKALNKDNNCAHYKKKWWKFWIKDKT